MKLITIETKAGTLAKINIEQIGAIFKDGDTVAISAAGAVITTKFTDVDHAADYVSRAGEPFFEQR